MRSHLRIKAGLLGGLLLVCGGGFGCGNGSSADTSAIVEGNQAAHDAWEKAKADGTDKHKNNKMAKDSQNRRGH